tara:strand:+ start:2385 stop:2789 length:405 start_codon:yes stop_codon:yes gene_type:complete
MEVKIKWIRKPSNLKEVFSSKPMYTNIEELQEMDIVILKKKAWKKLTNNFSMFCDFLPSDNIVQVSCKGAPIYIDCCGYKNARSVGVEVGTPQLTSCCNAYSTYHDDELICKVCFKNVPLGEGDGAATMGEENK